MYQFISAKNEIFCECIGPIDEWNININHPNDNCVILDTDCAFYKLTIPHPTYEQYYTPLLEKIKFTKIVIEKCKDNNGTEYEALLQYLSDIDDKYDEDFLIENAEFVCNIMLGLEFEDDIGVCDEPPYFTTPCMKTLIQNLNIPLSRDKVVESELRDLRKESYVLKKPVLTPLIEQVFDQKIYHQHMSSSNKVTPKKYRRNNLGKKAPSGASEADSTDSEDESQFMMTQPAPEMLKPKWISGVINTTDEKDFYSGALINLNKVIAGDFVETFAGRIGRVVSLFEDNTSLTDKISGPGNSTEMKNSRGKVKSNDLDESEGDEETEKEEICLSKRLDGIRSSRDTKKAKEDTLKRDKTMKAHVQWLFRPNDTILGDKIQFDDSTLFLTNICESINLHDIKKTVCVDISTTNENDTKYKHECLKAQCSQYHRCWQIYFENQARFEHLSPAFLETGRCCFCKPKQDIKLLHKHAETVLCYECFGEVVFKNVSYKIGDFILLEPECIPFDDETSSEEIMEEESDVRDSNIYPEYYRKTKDKHFVPPKARPMQIAYIRKIIGGKSDPRINVGLMFRPEDTNEVIKKRMRHDLNYVYWSVASYTVNIKHIVSPCHVLFKSDVPPPLTTWIKEGPNRFYFDKSYDPLTGSISPIHSADDISYSRPDVSEFLPRDPVPLETPLRCLDLFSGCGGLMEGLCQAGLAVPRWAVELEKSEATSYSANFQECSVFQDDCNNVLKSILKGAYIIFLYLLYLTLYLLG